MGEGSSSNSLIPPTKWSDKILQLFFKPFAILYMFTKIIFMKYQNNSIKKSDAPEKHNMAIRLSKELKVS